ncbi:MAG: GDSL-type esterase/lipase family protein [Myxococcota bacterium]
MRRQRLATTLLAVGSTVLALGVAEIVLRNVRTFAAETSSEYLVPHPTLGWSLMPGGRYQTAPDGDLFEVAYNTRGWRDVERTPGPVGTPRVVVLGDSFMEGYTVRLEDAFHRQLQARLRREHPEAQVVNLGVSGYGNLQALLAYELEGRRYQPDLVLLGFYLHNDLRDNSQEIESLRKPGSMKARNRPFLEPGEGWEITVVEAERSQRRYEAALARRASWWWRLGNVSHLWRMTFTSWIDSALRRIEEGPPIEDTLTREQRRELELAVFGCEVPPVYQRALEITKRVLVGLAERVRADGAQLVVFSVPSEYESVPVARGFTDEDLPCRRNPPLYAPIAAFLAEQGIPWIDLVPAFQREMQDGEPLFALLDSHWNAAGHAYAAKLVEQRLEALGLPEPAKQAPPADRS